MNYTMSFWIGKDIKITPVQKLHFQMFGNFKETEVIQETFDGYKKYLKFKQNN